MQIGIRLGGEGIVQMTPIRGDRIGNRVVEQAIESVKLVNGDRRIRLLCQLGDGLADISVTVDDLVHRVTLREQFLAMQASGTAVLDRYRGFLLGSGNDRVSRRRGRLLSAKRLDELIEE